MDTTIGAALALPAMYGLWPMWQHESFNDRLACNFQSVVNYFCTLEAAWRNPDTMNPIEIARARREGGLTNNAAEEALDQLLNELRIEQSMSVSEAFSEVESMSSLVFRISPIHLRFCC